MWRAERLLDTIPYGASSSASARNNRRRREDDEHDEDHPATRRRIATVERLDAIYEDISQFYATSAPIGVQIENGLEVGGGVNSLAFRIDDNVDGLISPHFESNPGEYKSVVIKCLKVDYGSVVALELAMLKFVGDIGVAPKLLNVLRGVTINGNRFGNGIVMQNGGMTVQDYLQDYPCMYPHSVALQTSIRQNVELMYEHGIVCNDLKDTNITFDVETNRSFIIDFGGYCCTATAEKSKVASMCHSTTRDDLDFSKAISLALVGMQFQNSTYNKGPSGKCFVFSTEIVMIYAQVSLWHARYLSNRAVATDNKLLMEAARFMPWYAFNRDFATTMGAMSQTDVLMKLRRFVNNIRDADKQTEAYIQETRVSAGSVVHEDELRSIHLRREMLAARDAADVWIAYTRARGQRESRIKSRIPKTFVKRLKNRVEARRYEALPMHQKLFRFLQGLL